MYKAEVKGEYSTAVSILDERHVYSSVRWKELYMIACQAILDTTGHSDSVYGQWRKYNMDVV